MVPDDDFPNPVLPPHLFISPWLSTTSKSLPCPFIYLFIYLLSLQNHGLLFFSQRLKIYYYIYFGNQSVPDLASGSPFLLAVSLWHGPHTTLSTSLLPGCYRLTLLLFCSSPGISCFSEEPEFLLVGNGIRDQDLGLGVLTAFGVSLLSGDSAKKYMHIYAHMRTCTYIFLHTSLYIHTYISTQTYIHEKWVPISISNSSPSLQLFSPSPHHRFVYPFFYHENPTSQIKHQHIYSFAQSYNTPKGVSLLCPYHHHQHI